MFQQVVTSSLPPQPKDHSQCPSQKRTHEKTNRQFPKYQKMKGVLWALVSWGGVRCFFRYTLCTLEDSFSSNTGKIVE